MNLKRAAIVLTLVLPNFGMAETLALPGGEAVQIPRGMERVGRMTIEALNRARATGQAPEGMGFLHPNSSQLPIGVQRSARSVFRIAVPEGNLINYKEIFGDRSLSEAIRAIQAAPLTPELGQTEKTIYMFQLQECLRLKIHDCKIFEGVSYGSAFVTGDGRDLRTALHVAEGIAKDAFNRERKHIRPAIVLVDSQNRIVARPGELNARVAAIPRGSLGADIYKPGPNYGNFNLDQVLIRIQKPVGPPLAIAAHKPAPGEPVFISAYPKKTEDRDLYMARNSDGVSLSISRGTALSPQALKDRASLAVPVSDADVRKIVINGISSTADAAPRSSGGAMLNARGEVVGIYTSGLPQSGSVFPFRISYGGNWLMESRGDN